MSKTQVQPVIQINVAHQATATTRRNLDGFFPGKARRGIRHVARHKVQKARTLMRHAVKQPKPQAHISSPAGALTSALTVAAAKTTPMLETAPQRRVQHAQKIHKSSLISKFGFGLNPVLTKRVAPLSIKQAPKTAHSASGVAQPAKSDHFAAALAGASNHESKPLKKRSLRHRLAHRLGRRSKLVGVLATGLVVLLLGGFFAYQNVPNFAMRVAASRAGFSAALPGYKPAGYALKNPIQYGPGRVSVTFRSSSDDRTFRIVQQSSSWNSETLLDNFVATSRQPYLTYQDKGKTIYIYNGANATWVNGGVWYQVESNASLSSDQLLKIANSL